MDGGAFGVTESSGESGRDWLSAGAGLLFELGERWSVLLDYEGRLLRSDRSDHFAAVRVSFKF